MILLSFLSPGQKTALGPIPKFSASWEAGVHAIVNTIDGSTAALFGALSGAAPAGACTTTLGEGVSWATLAHIPETVAWPGDLFVGEALAIAAAARGTPAPSVHLLDAFAFGGLVKARVRELEPATLRAIALLEALGSDLVRILLLDEGIMDGRVAPSLPSLLRARAASGAAVFVAAKECGMVDYATGELVLRAPTSGRVRVDTDDATALSKALAAHTPLRVEQSGRSTLWVEAPSTESAVEAVNRAITESRVAIDRLEVTP